MKVSVNLYEGVKPMSFLCSDQDIVKHVQGIGNITFATGAQVRSQGVKDINLKLWTEHFHAYGLDDSFFFEPGRDSMHNTIASTMTVLLLSKSVVKRQPEKEGGLKQDS